MFKEPQEGPCGWSWVSKGMSVRSVSFVSLLSVPEQDTQPLCAAEPQLPALGFTTRFWVFMDENLRSPILCFHFDHNLKDSHKSILWVTLIILRTEQSCGFHNHFYLVFFCNWLVPKWRPKIGACFMQEEFCSSLNRKEGQAKWAILDIEVRVSQSQDPGPGGQYHVNGMSGTPIFPCQLTTFIEAVLATVPCSFFSPAPRLSNWI